MCHVYFLVFNNVTQRTDQIYIEDAAKVPAPLCVGADNVGLEPNGLALEVACIVEVQIDFLLRKGIPPFRRRLSVFRLGHSIEFALIQSTFGICAGHDGEVLLHITIISYIVDGFYKVSSYLSGPSQLLQDVVFLHVYHHRAAFHAICCKLKRHVINLGKAVALGIVDIELYGAPGYCGRFFRINDGVCRYFTLEIDQLAGAGSEVNLSCYQVAAFFRRQGDAPQALPVVVGIDLGGKLIVLLEP